MAFVIMVQVVKTMHIYQWIQVQKFWKSLLLDMSMLNHFRKFKKLLKISEMNWWAYIFRSYLIQSCTLSLPSISLLLHLAGWILLSMFVILPGFVLLVYPSFFLFWKNPNPQAYPGMRIIYHDQRKTHIGWLIGFPLYL